MFNSSLNTTTTMQQVAITEIATSSSNSNSSNKEACAGTINTVKVRVSAPTKRRTQKRGTSNADSLKGAIDPSLPGGTISTVAE